MKGKAAKRGTREGWIDLQVNGRAGVSFTDARLSPEGVLKAVEALRDGGTEAFLATVITSSDRVTLHALRTIAAARRRYPECERRILGIRKKVEIWTKVSYQYENVKKHLYQTNHKISFDEE